MSNYFFRGDASLVRMSDRIYQPVDTSSLLKKPQTEVYVPKRLLKTVGVLILGFLIGGVLGQLLAKEVISPVEFGFLSVASGAFQMLSFSDSFSTIFSAGAVGSILSGVIGLLSLLQVPE